MVVSSLTFIIDDTFTESLQKQDAQGFDFRAAS